ncbi:serine hydrolase domain-containing protein [Flavihumibacter stibioxidans]|uniref:Serine hydrolase n=1 Tax=Flavihumibacter stibioxidans TaxID=1834163 RepID=A0ABR7M9D8_9BACT|nr:serine hydrolase domain-containing protein [Flavihumibacter stibioxidans]MBC6491644.1 serine hydrolase [Flavihumibacter stibioxidans]
MKNFLLAVLLKTLLLALPNVSVSQSSSPGNGVPEKAGFSAEGFSRLDRIVQQYIDSQWIAGASMIIVRDGQIAYHKALGFSDISGKEQLKKDHIFRIASQTKAITSTAIMILLEEGKLLLDDAVSKYIPAFAGVKVLDKFNENDTTYTTKPLKRNITIRDLLTHTSGIGYAQIGSKTYKAIAAKAGVYGGIGTPHESLADQVNRIATIPLEHQPGEKFTYGLNIDVLGYIVELVSKQSLEQFFRRRIFEPLGMQDTWFYLPADRRKRLVRLHGEDSLGRLSALKKPLGVEGKNIDPDFPNSDGRFFAGGAGLSSTAYDYALFMQMILNGGILNGKRILSPNSVKLMTTNQIGSLNNGNNKFGLGFGLVTEKEAARLGLSAGSFEWGGAFSSSYWIDPEKKIVAQLFINQWPNRHGDIHDKFKVQVYSALMDQSRSTTGGMPIYDTSPY